MPRNLNRRELTEEELDAEQGVELPQREAMSLLFLSPHQPLPLAALEEPPGLGDPRPIMEEPLLRG